MEDLNEIIVVKQLPEIQEQLKIISVKIDEEIENALSLNCTDENKQIVKRAKSRLNNIKAELEEKRKTVKSQIMKPYEDFETIYKELIINKLNNADKVLKDKIDEIENEEKSKKIVELQEFCDESIKNLHLENIISFDRLNLNVTLLASMKSLKETIKTKLEEISRDIKLIKLEPENGEEIIEEYLKDYNYARSRMVVIERHKKIEELKKMNENTEKIEREEEKIEEQVEEIIAPVEIEEEKVVDENQVMIYTFTVTGTKEEIIKVRDYLKQEGISYE